MASIVAAWPMVALSEVLRQDTTYISELEPRLYPKLSVPWWGKGVVLDPPADGSLVRMTRHQLARPGQVIVSEIWAKHGSIGIVPREGAGALVTSHFFLFDIDDTRLLQEYMGYLITANFLTEQIAAIARGTTGYASIRPHHFLSLTIPLPPLDEQRRIVARIEELAACIEEARGLRREAMAEAEALIPSEMSHKLASLTHMHSTMPLLKICDFVGGSQPPKSMFRYESLPGYVRFLQIRDYSSDENVTYIPESSRNRLVSPDEVLVGRYGASLGKVLRGKAGAYNVAMCKAVPRSSDISLDYLALVLEFGPFQARLRGLSRSAQAGFNKADVRNVDFVMPPIQEQRRITAQLNDLRTKVERLRQLQEETLAELEALLPSVLEKAFRGEL